MNELVRLAIVGALALIVHAYGHTVVDYLVAGDRMRIWEAIIVSITFLLVIYFILELTLTRLTHLPGIRKLFYPYSQLEGYWYQEVAIADRPHSVSRIKHTFLKRTWFYEGYGYSENFETRVRWTSVHLDFSDEKWIFRGNVEHLDGKGDVTGYSHTISVLYTNLSSPFFRKGEQFFGRAVDLDFDKPAAGFKIELIRINKANWMEISIREESLKLNPQIARQLITAVRRRGMQQ
jgi:hypothetical protein